MTQQEIIDALRMQIDPVCLPRPLYQIAQLPRSDTGKLPRQAVLELLARLRES